MMGEIRVKKIFLIAQLLLVGCSWVPAKTQKMPANYTGEYGYVAGSIAGVVGGPTINDNDISSLLFRSKDGAVNGRVTYTNSVAYPQDRDFEDSEIAGLTFFLKLPVGEYEFYNVHFYDNDLLIAASYHAKKPFSLPFVIKTGTVTYVGQLLSHGDNGENVFGMDVTDGGFFTYTDESKRDFSLLRNKHNEFDSLNVEKSILNSPQ